MNRLTPWLTTWHQHKDIVCNVHAQRTEGKCQTSIHSVHSRHLLVIFFKL